MQPVSRVAAGFHELILRDVDLLGYRTAGGWWFCAGCFLPGARNCDEQQQCGARRGARDSERILVHNAPPVDDECATSLGFAKGAGNTGGGNGHESVSPSAGRRAWAAAAAVQAQQAINENAELLAAARRGNVETVGALLDKGAA